jgi:hypothetical protein
MNTAKNSITMEILLMSYNAMLEDIDLDCTRLDEASIEWLNLANKLIGGAGITFESGCVFVQSKNEMISYDTTSQTLLLKNLWEGVDKL